MLLATLLLHASLVIMMGLSLPHAGTCLLTAQSTRQQWQQFQQRRGRGELYHQDYSNLHYVLALQASFVAEVMEQLQLYRWYHRLCSLFGSVLG